MSSSDLSARLEGLSREERAALVKLLRQKKEAASAPASAPPPPPPSEARRDLPLSFAQQRLWFLDRLAPGNPVYNVPIILRLLGRLDVAVLAACLNEIVRRHASLRTRFEIRGDGPVQIIEPPAPVALPVVDLSALSAGVRVPEEQRIAFERENAPFDLSRPPLLRACLVRLGAEEHLLIHVLHHIASDGWSVEVAVGEVAALYPAFLAGRPSPLPELTLQYADFAWQQIQTLQGATLAREIGFWRERLAGASPLELPTDRPRPAVPSFRGNALEVVLPATLEAGLRRLAREQRATPFMALLAPLCAFLGRIANTDDVVMGTMVAGRDRRDIADLIGFFVNTLILRLDLGGDPDGLALLAQARQVTLEAFDHQALPFEKLVDELGLPRNPYRPPLLRALYQLLTIGRISDDLPGVKLERFNLPVETAKFDLTVNAGELPDQLQLEWRYDADLFDASTIARWSGMLEVLLAGWLDDPARRVSELPLLTEIERLQLLTVWSTAPLTAGSADRGRRSLPALFEAQVDRAPDAPAVSSADAGLTYRELDARANRLARWLVEAGVVPGDRVALSLDRSPDLVVSLLGVLKTGAAYVPLDPSSPRERLAFALENSGARVLLDTALLEREAEAIARLSGERLGWNLDPELPAYVIYTSGSTGHPKGVIVPHGAVSCLFAATAPWFGFGPDDVWTLFHSYAFDFSIWEIWGALLHGGRLVVVPWPVSRDPAAFLDLLGREGVTVLNQTPSAFRQLLAQFPPLPVEGLRLVIFGGEALDPTMLAPWLDRHGDERPRLVNMYGITETTVHVTYRPLTREDAARPASRIGRPIPDLTLHVLDRHLQLQPAGVPGEICVGGAGLAHGYLDRPDLTAARFVPDPFGEPGSRLYRSGDLARRRPDGDLEFLGRIDTQVKIRGFRIEPGEIEAAIAAHPAVREAVVLARQDGSSEPRLVAYLTAEPEGAPSFAELRDVLAGRLPDYMLPSALVVLDRLPLTANGKVDRRALPAPEAVPAAASGHEHVPPRDALESSLAGLVRRVLNVPAAREIGVLDNFFELGGSSISGAVLINLLQEILGEIVHVVVLFDHPTVESLASYVREQHAEAAARVWGTAPAETIDERSVGPAEVYEMLRLIEEGRPEADVQESSEPPNPPAVFLLSPPRSGSTLLRVMLGIHPRLFAPPELELLSFQTLGGREAAFSGRDGFWLEGAVRAVMEARSCDAAEAAGIIAAGAREGWTTRRFYRELQGWIGDRLLVDKTPSYALDPAVLHRAEQWFSGARYIHLVRHPQATNRSFEEARLDQIFFRRPHRFSRRQLAELIWTVSHRHILDFLAEVPAERRHTVRFEELVREPERALSAICGFLGVELDPAMVDPYRDGAARMTGGVHEVSRMLGDVKFHAHGKVDASVADRWKQAESAPLGAPARAVTAELGYSLAEPASRGAWEEGGTAPVSFAQERMWLIEQLMPGTPTYNIPGGFRLHGRLDVPAFARAFREIVRRHAALRTVFAPEEGRPVQKIAPALSPSGSPPLPVIDLGALPEAVRDAEVTRIAAAEAALPFDLERGPLIRGLLLRLDPREHVAVYTFHHIVSDGWSMGIFFRETAMLYEAFAAGRPSPLPELRLQYPDYALRQRGRLDEEGLAQELAWWKQRLAGLEPLELPTDRPRPAVRSGRGAQTLLLFRPGLARELTALGRGERATLYMVLLAVFQGFLQRLARQDDIAVGSPVAHRSTRDVEELIGFFVNTLVMRTDLSGDPTFREMLVRVRGTALEAMLHQDAPFERVVEAVQPERQLSRTPLFQVLFTLQNAGGGPVELPGLILEEAHPPMVTAKFDLTVQFGDGPDGLGAGMEFDVDLFDAVTAERMLRHLESFLEGAVASPGARLSDLPLLTPAERAMILTAWNQTQTPFPRETPVHHLVAEQAVRTPDAVALVSAARGEITEVTYGELVAAARRLARRLRRLGAAPEVPVLVLAERSPALVEALLAVLESGAFFVPLDPQHPRERLAALAGRVGARLAVTEERFLDLLPAGVETVCLDRLDRHAAEPAVRVDGGATAENLMYVMFTSGSTGEPKGVAVTHRNVARLVKNQEHADLRPGETFLLLAPVSFDASTLEIWGPLANGARLAIFPPEKPTLEGLAVFLERQGVTQLWLTAGLFHQMVEERPEGLAPLRRLLAGGDVLAPSPVRRALAAHPGLVLVNGYGPTEGTTFTTCHVMTSPEQVGDSVPIGRPLANTRVHVLEAGFQPAPVGVWGELYAGGEGLARGYFGRPDLTAERFVPDPFAGVHGASGDRLYRTGDLARRRPDGVLEFLGRGDRQVKIRGFRIEPAEIEAALAEHPAVSEAAVLVRGEGADKRLVGYVVPREMASDGSDRSDDLRRFLAGRLPEPMIPSDFVVLPRLPLTPNGKVDRRELAKIAPERATADYVAPRTPVEEVLAGLFAEVLGAERTGGRVGIHDDFFTLGGHSLAATRLVSRLRAALGVELPLRALFEASTVAGLALRCGLPDAVARTPEIPLAAAPRDPAGEPLSFSQERLWVLDRLDPGTSTYNLPSRARLRGPLDPARLALCFGEVVRRHEALRTRFAQRDGAPVQVVDPPAPFVLPLVDLSGLPEAARGPAAESLAGEEAGWPFDLERGPLLRAVLLRLGGAEHGLLVDLHHIITDGWSMGILFRELAALYAALTAQPRASAAATGWTVPSPLPPLPVQVADVARWQRERLAGPALEAQLAFWRERLGGAPAALDLPLDRTRPAMQTFRGDSIPWLLPAELAGRLRALARHEGASVFMVLLAGLDLLLARQSGQDDVLVGTPVAGRNHPALEDLIGCFLNTLVLRVDLSGRPTGRALVERAKDAALGAYAHQDIPFEKLLQDLQPERDLSRTPLFQVFLNMLNFPDAGASLPDGLVLEPLDGTGVDSKFDLTLYAAEGETGIALNLVYNADLFEGARMEELVRQLQSVLEQLAAAPDAPVEAISLLTPEAAALLPDPREPLGTAWVGSVHSLFAEQARRRPERPAVSDAEGAWTYGELAEAVSRLAARLRADGLAPGEPVAIWAHRSAPVAMAMMATAWSGGAFVMLDPAYPPERLVTILELAAPRYWIELAAAGAPPAEVEEALERLAAAGTLRGRAILPGGGPAGARAFVETLPAPVEPAAAGPDDLAYIAFTSGSTGIPKGIEGRHGPLSHFLPFLRERFGLTDEDRTSLLSGLSHDPLQRDVFTPLCLGAALAAPTFDEISTPGRLAAWMAREGITIAHLTPAMAQLLTETGAGPAPSIPTLRWVLLVGDVLTRLDVDRLRRIAPGVTCVNLYGSTETQRSVAYHVVEESEIADARAPQVLPLGRGMRDVQLLVVSRGSQELAGVGEVGEIWMRGPHLARGYLGDDALTADRFRTNPFTGVPGDRVYRTGDLGRYRPDGEAAFAGRADQQVKIRGFRIELGEIEAALGRLPGVREAVVLAPESRPGDRRLIAYLTGEGLDRGALREALGSRLPAYMVPADFVLLDRLPVTPNGKVDRRSLSQTAARIVSERSAAGYVAPRTPVEETLAGLFAEVLGEERTGRIGIHDHFFELGGHSLAAARLMSRLSAALGIEVPLRALFEAPTVAGLAARVPVGEQALAAARLAPAPRDPAGDPLSFSQERLWFLERLTPGTSAYSLPSRMRLLGPLDPTRLARCFSEVRRRHEVLRTRFVVRKGARGGAPVQIVDPPVPFVLPLVDLTALPEDLRRCEAERQASEEMGQPFDLERGPLLRVTLVRLGAAEHAVLLSFHHIITDGWSMRVLFGEVAALYQAFAEGRTSPLPELPVQYADVARWQREALGGPALDAQLAWWRRQLGGAPPSLDLPLDRVRPAVQTFHGAAVSGRVPAELAGSLRALANREGASLFMVLLAGFGLLLSRLSGQDDVVVGSPVAGRNRPELESLIGCFLNTLALRLDLASPAGAGLTRRALVGRARDAALGAYEHQDVPFERLLEDLQPERDLSRTPLFQVFLNVLNFPASSASMPDGLVLEPLGGAGVDSKFDCTIYAAEDADGIALNVVYNADLLDRGRVEEMVRQLRLILEQIAAAPDAPVESISLRTAEAAAVLPDPREALGDAWIGAVHELFAEQARLHPERPAVSDAGMSWTYGELAAAAARLAARLRADGLRAEEPVAIWAHRGARTVQAVFGTLWAGGAFVLLDPAYPPARLAETVELAAPRYWIQSGLEIAAAGAPPAEVEEVLDRLAVAGTLRGRLSLPGEGPDSFPAPVAPAAVGPEDAVAIAFTSGSTGAPKGIVQRHGSMSHFLPFLAERFGIGPEDRFSLLSGLSHDPFQRDLFTSLCLGASLCAPTAEEMTLPGRLAAWMARERITVSNLTPAMAQLLTETGSEPPRPLPELRLALLIGDALTRADVERLRRLAPGAVCVNLYGTTETQRALGMHLVTREEIEDPRAPQVLPLGRGMPDVQLLVVFGDRLAGIGELGEIEVRSPHLARGYLGGEGFGDRYRTGDLGRYRPDGEVVFAGRADQQVKIRGFRIEPAEIEAALGRQPGVREAVVLPRSLSPETTGPGDRELVAYVAGEDIDPARLRETLRSRLPGYMVPAAFVLLDELPVTPNGKVDRRALSRIEPARSADGYVAPRTPAEKALAALWAEVLGPQRTGGRVGSQDHFFALGGHSLLATRLIAAVRDAFDIELPLRVVFERPALAEMAAAIEGAGAAGSTLDEPVVPIPREPGVNRFPVSFSQLREWILDRLEPGNPAYNIPNNLRIGGPLSIPVLTEALNRLVQRHEVFRTSFVAGDEEPLQVVHPDARLDVPVIDLSALPEEAREAELGRRVRHQAGTGFDLTVAPLLRARVVRLGAGDHGLLMTVHHIVTDGWSMGILNQELAALYEAAARSLPSSELLPPLPVQYADYAVWQRRRLDGEALERQAGYWRQRLAGAPPLLELPTDRPRPPVRSSRGARIPFLLPQPLVGRMDELALRHGATLFMVLLAGYQSLLARWSGQEDVVTGTYSGNRPRRELEGLIGFFINTLVLRTGLAGDPSFAELLGRVRETTLGAYAHRDLPFEKLLETLQLPRDPSRTPLFQAHLVFQNFPPVRADLTTGVRLASLPVLAEHADYDLALWVGEGPDGLGGALEYSTDLFDEATIVRFAGQLRHLLEAAVAEPGRNIWTLPLIAGEEQARQLAAWSRGPAVPEGPPLLHRLVEEQAARTPTAVAVEAGGVRLTYAELVEQARRVAEGIDPGTIVALTAERTPELIVQMLGVLQAGAAYLPIDPAYPRERRAYMLEDAGAKDIKDIKDDKDSKDSKDIGSSSLESFGSLSSLTPAYVIYTSGSTGRPKGVVVPHHAIASFVRAAREAYEIGPGDRVLQFASISFDTSAEEIWPALAAGATLVLRPEEMAASIPHFLRELERLGITHLDLPTAYWHEMVAVLEAEELELPRELRLIILGGEEALAVRFALWHRRVGSSVRLVNTYGPTETTIVATRRELTDLAPGGTVPIGRPIPGARAYVLDRFFAPVPPGVRGELWIGGAGVARGYLGRPELTAERFIPDPFSASAGDNPGARLYRTGDLAVLKPDGDLVFAGRADRQLKIRGYRIEPGEIEAALRLHPALRDAVVDAQGARDDRRLIAWIVPHEGNEIPGASDLRAFLRERLPEPLLPAAFVPVETLPLTPSGKVDRRALPQPAEAGPGGVEAVAYAEPQSALERTIAEIYRDLLRVGRVGLHDNFFDLGGHSLLIVRAHQKLREALGKEIPVLDLFRFPTVAALARHLGGEETGTLQKVQGFAEQQRAAQQRQRAAMERLRRPGRRG